MTNEATANKRFLNLKEMAAFLNRTPQFVRDAVKERIIPSIKLPRRDRIFEREKVIAALLKYEDKETGR